MPGTGKLNLQETAMQLFRTITIIMVALTFITLASCSSAERRASRAEVKTYESQTKTYESQLELNKRKMKLVDEYQDCIKKSKTAEESENCDSYLRAAEGL